MRLILDKPLTLLLSDIFIKSAGKVEHFLRHIFCEKQLVESKTHQRSLLQSTHELMTKSCCPFRAL